MRIGNMDIKIHFKGPEKTVRVCVVSRRDLEYHLSAENPYSVPLSDKRFVLRYPNGHRVTCTTTKCLWNHLRWNDLKVAYWPNHNKALTVTVCPNTGTAPNREDNMRKDYIDVETTRQQIEKQPEREDVIRIYAKDPSDVLDLQHLAEQGIGEVVEHERSGTSFVCLEIRPSE